MKRSGEGSRNHRVKMSESQFLVCICLRWLFTFYHHLGEHNLDVSPSIKQANLSWIVANGPSGSYQVTNWIEMIVPQSPEPTRLFLKDRLVYPKAQSQSIILFWGMGLRDINDININHQFTRGKCWGVPRKTLWDGSRPLIAGFFHHCHLIRFEALRTVIFVSNFKKRRLWVLLFWWCRRDVWLFVWLRLDPRTPRFWSQ